MFRVISLFREPREEDQYPPQKRREFEIECEEQPLYFQQLLEYLREQKQPQKRAEHLDEKPEQEPMVLA